MTNSWSEIWNLRASLYGFLANSLLDPIQGDNTVFTQKFWRNFPLDAANDQIKSGLEQLILCSASLEELSEEKAIENVMVEYTSLFLGPGHPKAPPCESFYRNGERLFFGRTAFAMKETLYQNGLESKRKNKQPEDHIGIELMLLSVLSSQLIGLEESKQVSLVKEQLFLIDEHLLSWINEFCEQVKLHGSTGFYGGLIELAWGILLWDRELLEEFMASNEQVG
ncbi:TorD/DmsD family molecular chaperone [Neobacillus kokaensis]|uniref:Dehydrogenase n=1 Tax=Neobacillus kokaensis TaxID=2759023 RepID=A0ABQ3N7R4_9BACI|nr:molecular chaperone TorD family protein [Neobacillus kokaensis]GHH99900.1 dehydrogenase [Neobacillus kokaensis]